MALMGDREFFLRRIVSSAGVRPKEAFIAIPERHSSGLNAAFAFSPVGFSRVRHVVRLHCQQRPSLRPAAEPRGNYPMARLRSLALLFHRMQPLQIREAPRYALHCSCMSDCTLHHVNMYRLQTCLTCILKPVKIKNSFWRCFPVVWTCVSVTGEKKRQYPQGNTAKHLLFKIHNKTHKNRYAKVLA